jgi:hypothetical protein
MRRESEMLTPSRQPLRPHPAARRVDDERARALEPRHRRALEHRDAALACDSHEATREERRLHGRRGGLEDAADVHRRAAAPRELAGLDGGEGTLAMALDRRNRALPRAELGAVRRGPQPAVSSEVGIDAMLVAERADLADRGGRRAREPQRVHRAADPLEADEVVPDAHREAAVATARAGAADLGLDEDDLERGLAPLERQRRPQPGEAAADDAHVGAKVALERAPGRADRGLAKPPAAVCGRARAGAGGWCRGCAGHGRGRAVPAPGDGARVRRRDV